ncbi:DUF3332 family protein [Fibrobacter sp.]|jgi:hypothetical protein|uniref:DUF3332 family protein n=1 Tax=Fibrobacter sp. TaxID=35828 RepID=UPI0025C45A44|nr:DUF3332 family protein [Fibrobacter sp.]MBS7272202.1 DUF3332 family protein [Fibrobacter sp.]MCI6437368.1 DUF3332 domain-containing protein [Fibrobacter sp.]MDD5943667.1 DUF3332 family protein [Fibrobacter sp.]MDD7499118.1 DUF3332 family protein [Fibrobacter sp.]MDY5723767.1 DUF3332 family protein [Fibrobacter sp.]
MKKGIVTLLCAGMIVLSGCYGKNACFNKLHDWNGTLGDKWINSIVHFILFWLPVYGICLFLVDGLVLNTIEFWTGSNPLASGDSYFEKDAQGNTIAAVKNEDGSMSVELTTAKGEKANLTLQRDENVVRALDNEGNVVAQYEIEK